MPAAAVLPFHPFIRASFVSPSCSQPRSKARLLLSSTFPNYTSNSYDDDDEPVIGDCIVFEDGAFEDGGGNENNSLSRRSMGKPPPPEAQSLVPDRWRQAVEEINLGKKEKRKIAHNLKFGAKVARRPPPTLPDVEQYRAYREAKLAELNSVVLDDPRQFAPEKEPPPPPPRADGRVAPRNPRLVYAGGSLDEITEFFNSDNYSPPDADDKNPRGQTKLFTNEEKVLLNRRKPDLEFAGSSKWLPLHTLAASGEYYLLDKLLKLGVDINTLDEDGLSALHKAVLCKKQAIFNYLLRNSANPFLHDKDGATLLHYAVQTASVPMIKILLLYNVDINLSDDHGWTALHLAVQAQRTDIAKILLIKGADRSVRNRDGLTPLEMCLYSGHSSRIHELIKLLKEFPESKPGSGLS